MKQFIKMICILTLLVGFAFSANSRVLKSEFKKEKMNRVEPNYRQGTAATRDACPHQYPNNPNSELTVIDSSSNGFGMVSTVTRPFDVNSDGNMLVVYRQYAGDNTTHGQLGAGYGVVTPSGGINWSVQYNVNKNGSEITADTILLVRLFFLVLKGSSESGETGLAAESSKDFMV